MTGNKNEYMRTKYGQDIDWESNDVEILVITVPF